MGIISSETTVTFSHPFQLGDMDRQQPAGAYRVVSDDEVIPDLQMRVLRRIASFLHVPAIGATGRTEVYAVTPAALAAAQAEDIRHAQAVKAERGQI